MEILREAPDTGSFIPLSEHQSTTPVSFHSGPPVLHYYSDRCKVIVLENELQNVSALLELTAKVPQSDHSNEQENREETNGNHAAEKTLEEIDVWVTSEYTALICFR